MSRRLRVSAPPPVGKDSYFNLWAQQVTDALNLLPNFSLSSTTDGPNSYVTGDPGTLLIDVGSSNTTFWIKLSGDSTLGWSAVDVA